MSGTTICVVIRISGKLWNKDDKTNKKDKWNFLKVVRSTTLSPTSTAILLPIEKGVYTVNSHFGRVLVRFQKLIPGHWGHRPIYRPICPDLISSKLGR